MFYTEIKTHIVDFILAGDETGIKYLGFDIDRGNKLKVTSKWEYNNDLFKDSVEEIKNFFLAKSNKFLSDLSPQGTEFQKKVWSALLTIPFGETRTYKEIASQIGNDKASRAVGMANNKNPISIIIPCHRVIGASGKLVGYAGGLNIKEKLLGFEKMIYIFNELKNNYDSNISANKKKKSSFIIDNETIVFLKRIGFTIPESNKKLKIMIQEFLGSEFSFYQEYNDFIHQHFKKYCKETPNCNSCFLSNYCKKNI